MRSSSARSSLFYGALSAVMLIIILKVHRTVLPGALATQVGHNSEALLFALLLCAQVQFLRPLAFGPHRTAGERWAGSIAVAALLAGGGFLLQQTDWSPAIVTLNEPLIGAGMMALYLALGRPLRAAPIYALAVLAVIVLGFNTSLVLNQAESLVPLLLAPLALDICDRRVLEPGLPPRNRLRLIWMLTLVGTAVSLIALAPWARTDLHGPFRLGVDYGQRAAEAYWGWLLIHAYFAWWLGPERRTARFAGAHSAVPNGEEGAPDRIRVLYVGGLGRSGSTLLERGLAQGPGVTGLGETVYLWQRGIVHDETCGCGQSFSSCVFWTRVGDLAFGGWDRVDTRRIQELQRRVDDVKHVPRLLLPVRGEGRFARDLAEYLDHYERLYAAVAQVSGARVMVDSSKITSLAYALSHSGRLDVSMVRIQRDPRAVAHAWTKVVRRPEVLGSVAFMPRYSPAYMAALYAGHHVLLALLRLRGVPSVTVRYEDFADRPLATLAAVADGVDVPFDKRLVSGAEPGSLRLGTVHTASGNPSRFATGDIAVRRDEVWRTAMPARRRALVAALSAPVLVAQGYPLRVRPFVAPTAGSAASLTPRPRSVPDDPDDHAGPAWPSVTAVIPTHDRPELMREAVRSVVKQDYPGVLRVLLVFDKSEPDLDLVSHDPRRPVDVVVNTRTPGLAGARNTGILAATTDLVAFLDDDDTWVRDKLTRQVAAFVAEPGAEFASTSIRIDYGDRDMVRLAGRTRVHHEELLRSRLAMLHSSSFLADRAALIDGIGLVDETIPRSMAEDWDILLRAAARRPIVHVDEPLVHVRWGPTSYFADQWEARNAARLWMLEHHPGIARDRTAAGLTYGKLAFGEAMLGHRAEAFRWARRAARADWRQPRTPLAMLVTTHLIRGQFVVDQLNRRGHGI